jgi:flagellar basal-body rod modification protein FlgD
MAITAKVTDGVLDYDYTDSSKSTQTSGTDLGYDQFLQLLCAEMQYQDPLEPTSNTDYVAQLATFSQLEATMSMESTQQNTFASSLVGKQVILATEDSNGNTKNITGRVDYVMYQSGEAYLSVNGSLYPLSDLDTVADTDYYDAAILGKTFASMVATLPETENLTTAYKGAVEEVRALYDDMTDYQKQFVSDDDLTALKKVEERLAELLALEEAQKNNTNTVETAEGTTEETAETMEGETTVS